MAAQFFSALADNALLIAAIFILRDMHAPAEYEPLLKTFFTVSYVASPPLSVPSPTRCRNGASCSSVTASRFLAAA
jgi:hypothetical protein